ncbi:fibrinogen alpha chain [Anguilla anguilla]|uniref:fibrinogen alpha chain n=1 Tax=Anguilla anguilla TaxID=7936 RepID=UPI0015AB5188|nr:fibrinogen alpha chain [Anguilla anguilla]
MGLLYLSCCFLALVFSVHAVLLDPRGARPVEHGYKASECATEKEWPACTDDDWGPKCPSGCRIQGLLDQADRHLVNKIDKIRKFLEENRRHYRSTDQVTKQTYDFLRDRLVTDSGNDNKYMGLAEQLRTRIASIKVKIEAQLRLLQALKGRVLNQVKEMKRLEVDIDIKLRSCKGSCASYTEYSVDRDSYITLDKQLAQLEAMAIQRVETVTTLRVMKSTILKEVSVPSIYKSGAGEGQEQKQDFFADVDQRQLSLEGMATGSTSTTVNSRDPGTGHLPSTATGSSTNVHSSTHTISCTKTIKKETHTKDGSVEKVEVVEESPECKGLDGHGKDGTGTTLFSREFGSFFEDPTNGKSITTFSQGGGDDLFKFTSHSSTSTKSVKGGSLKDVFSEFGGLTGGAVEEDLPDIHARSLKSPSEARQSDYVGKDCVDILQKHTSGDKSGLFKIKPDGSQDVVEVYCDHDTMLAGWVLVQQRMDGSVNFNRTWKDYRDGFGSVDQRGRGEFWLGNKYLHLLTQAESMLRVELEDWEGQEFYAEYLVRIGTEAEGYPIHVSGYQGNAGDALVSGQPDLGAFLSHANMKFSTYDRDNDKWEENCAEMYGGGWWYNNCRSANLNGIYFKGGQYDPGSNVPYEIENGVVWLPLKPADYSLKTVRMKVRPIATM